MQRKRRLNRWRNLIVQRKMKKGTKKGNRVKQHFTLLIIVSRVNHVFSQIAKTVRINKTRKFLAIHSIYSIQFILFLPPQVWGKKGRVKRKEGRIILINGSTLKCLNAQAFDFTFITYFYCFVLLSFRTIKHLVLALVFKK